MHKKHKIIIVDDHSLFRLGLKFVLERSEKIEIIGEASTGVEFLKLIENMEPDLVLMDIDMPVMNGIDATRKAVEQMPEIKIIALTMFTEQEYYFQMIQAGAKGFIHKHAERVELEQAIDTVANGENYFSKEIMRRIIMDIGQIKNKQAEAINEVPEFSERELEIIRHICNGLSNKEIADKLSLSLRTVEGHKTNILQKANVKNSINLVMFALRNKLVRV